MSDTVQALKRIFWETSFPAIFGIILAVMVWFLVQLHTAILEIPLIETRLTCTSSGNRTFVQAKLYNTNPDKLINELEVILTIKDPSPHIKYLTNSHGLEVPTPSRLKGSPTLTDKDFKFIMAEFQPNTRIVASALIIGTTKPDLILNSPKQAITPMNRNLITIFVKNRIKIFFVCVLLYLVLAGTYIYKLSKRYKNPIS